jgi:hypothetical protein
MHIGAKILHYPLWTGKRRGTIDYPVAMSRFGAEVLKSLRVFEVAVFCAEVELALAICCLKIA